MQLARSAIAIFLCELLIFPLASCQKRVEMPQAPLAPAVFKPLSEALHQPYLRLFEQAPRLEFSRTQIESMRVYLDQSKDYCTTKFENRAKTHEEAMDKAQAELRRRTAKVTEAERHRLHCDIQNSRILASQARTLAQHAIPVAYDNKQAKLKLIGEWPQDLERIKREISSGEYVSRQYGDVKDIGFRKVGEGQEDDVKTGRETIEEMKRTDLLPPEIDNAVIREYASDLGKRLASKSDLRVPVKITVLNSKEINAFALPGGFLFLQRGLLEAVEDEAQLAGVVAHEIAHASARHGHKLMRRATIASIIYQAAQVAALVLTGGAVGIGTYYALQYGFMGLGLVLNLDLLGVSRDFELEADRLGVQYAWNAGYDPSGFVRFFDKMATTEGYVDGASWFRTHPPFYERMVQTQQEIMFLPPKSALVTNRPEFDQMKKELAKVSAKAKEEEAGKPSLKAPEEGCPPPQKLEYEPGQPIETICSMANGGK